MDNRKPQTQKVCQNLLPTACIGSFGLWLSLCGQGLHCERHGLELWGFQGWGRFSYPCLQELGYPAVCLAIGWSCVYWATVSWYHQNLQCHSPKKATHLLCNQIFLHLNSRNKVTIPCFVTLWLLLPTFLYYLSYGPLLWKGKGTLFFSFIRHLWFVLYWPSRAIMVYHTEVQSWN